MRDLTPSHFAVLLAPGLPAPAPEGLGEALLSHGIGCRLIEPVGEDDWRLVWDGGEVWASAWQPEDPALLRERYRFLPEAFEDARRATTALHVRMRLDAVDEAETPRGALHLQLRILHTLAAHGVAAVDISAMRIHPAAWLARVAASRVPPAVGSLIQVHAVVADSDSDVWLHTHGLGRMTGLELEVLDAPRAGARDLRTLLESAAAALEEEPDWEEGAPRLVGYDLTLGYLRWERAIEEMHGTSPGRAEDRADEHGAPAGVLFVLDPTDGGRFVTPTSLLPVLQGNPVFALSLRETQRRAQVAAEGFPTFRAAQRRIVGKEGWRFLVKLGYTPEGEDDDGAEHLWYEVHAIEGAVLDATLLNDPWRVTSQKRGERRTHYADHLSDWVVHGPSGSYGPEDVEALSTCSGAA